MRAGGVESFGVNLFVPGEPTADPGRVAAYVASLEPEAEHSAPTVGEPTWDDDDYDAKLEVVLAERARRGELHLRPPRARRRARPAGRRVPGAGARVTHARGGGAGVAGRPRRPLPAGRRGGRAPRQPGQRRPPGPGPPGACAARRGPPPHARPARGGRRSGRSQPTSPTCCGAGPIWCKRARRSCAAPRAALHPRYKEALGVRGGAAVPGSIGATAMTRAFSGRRARALVNTMVREHPGAPPAYPEINNATRPLRAAAARAGDAGHMSLYAGTGFRAAPDAAGGRGGGVAGVGGAAVSRRRETMTIEFRPPDVAAVADSLADAARRGERLDQPAARHPRGRGRPRACARDLFAFFGNRAAPVSMATVMPAKKERRDSEGVTIGLMHPTGAKAVARLAEAGVEVPAGWVVRQDHARRGLLVQHRRRRVGHGHPHLVRPRRRRLCAEPT